MIKDGLKRKFFALLVIFSLLALFSNSTFFLALDLIIVIVCVTVLIIRYKKYRSSAYYLVTKLPYHKMFRDSGKYGEYLTYVKLKPFESSGAKFLFNLYLPKENNETTEIDVIMISNKGIFVFESKNYSGWIFGNEKHRFWTQTLPAGFRRSHKEQFYNPIMQNYTHIEYLKKIVGDTIPTHSIIVFSERCVLKNVQVTSENICVVNRYNLIHSVKNIYDNNSLELNDENVLDLYNKLYAYTQVNDEVKSKHIEDIRSNIAAEVSEPIVLDSKNDMIDGTVGLTPEYTEQNDKENENTIDKAPIPDEKSDSDSSLVKEDKKICPRCGKDLILRTAKRGDNAGNQFYGCSGYPKCRYIQGVE